MPRSDHVYHVYYYDWKSSPCIASQYPDIPASFCFISFPFGFPFCSVFSVFSVNSVLNKILYSSSTSSLVMSQFALIRTYKQQNTSPFIGINLCYITMFFIASH